MATVELPPVTLATPVPEQRITLHGVDWATYQRLVEIIGDRPIRKAFNRGVLELMSPGKPNEDYKALIGEWGISQNRLSPGVVGGQFASRRVQSCA